MKITIPAELTPLRAINFSNYISQCKCDSEFIYDFGDMQHCHPFGLLVISSAIRHNKKRYPHVIHRVVNYQATQGCQFASTFGFFQSADFDIGHMKEENDSGYRCVPIKKITAKFLHTEYTDTTLLNEKVNRQAGLLSDTLVGDQPQSIRDAMQYSFREIMRNVFEHANTDELWVCGQYWPSRDEAEIAILDEGIGILGSLRTNRKILAETCSEANRLALQPGLSRTLGMKQDPFDKWQNSGYGLYVASSLGAITGGYFILSSGDSAIFVNGQQQQEYDSSQRGTAICLNIHTNSKKLRNFDNSLSAIVSEGEQNARQNGDKRILTASQVTTIASMVRHIESNYQQNFPETLLGEDLIPTNTNVLFIAHNVNRQGELYGTFEYNSKTYRGILLNVSGANRELYIRNEKPTTAVVRKCKNGSYILLEKHKYEKLKRTQSKS